MEKISSGCPLDCFDCCKLNVYVEDNKIVNVEGDKNHPYTKGKICKKGLKHLERFNHPSRQYKPLLKVDDEWKEISFEEALDIMAEKLKLYKKENGVQSVLYYEQYGSGSLLKSMGDIFFNFFGGASKQKGGPCWSAGMAAQKRNFGDARSHSLEDMLNSKTIIVWGKNPAYTTIHTMKMIKEAKKKGSYVIVIDPIYTATAKQADYYVQIKPNGDSALALAMAKRIVEKNKHDEEYIDKYVNGFEEYKLYLSELNFDDLCEKAGVTEEVVDFLVEKYTELYSTILLGYGLQKYAHGGNTISLINTLGAITGQVGESGGGVNYANKVFPGVLNLDPYNSEEYADNRFFYTSKISSYIDENDIKMAVIVKSNLLNQLPNLVKLEKSLRKVEFKVCFDQFLTDTAEVCDLFIPTTTVFEGEDLLYSSMTNPYITYIEKAVEPRNILMDEYEFFRELAKRAGVTNYPDVDRIEYLTKVIEPLKTVEPKMSLDYIKDNYFTIHESIAWKNKMFKTASGKFEIVFDKELGDTENKEGRFRLLTNHGQESLFSQHYMDKEDIAEVHINSKMCRENSFEDGELIYMKTPKGKIEVKVKIDDNISDNIAMMYVGWWKKHGNPNWIIESGISDIGGQVTYNDNFIELVKL